MELLIERPPIMPRCQAISMPSHQVSALKFAHQHHGKATTYLVRIIQLGEENLRVSLICVVDFFGEVITLRNATGVQFIAGKHNLQYIIEPDAITFTVATNSRVVAVADCNWKVTERMKSPLKGLKVGDLLFVKFLDEARSIRPDPENLVIPRVNIALWQTIDVNILPVISP